MDTLHKQELATFLKIINIKFPIVTEARAGMYQCLLCKQTFLYINTWKNHIMTHSELFNLFVNMKRNQTSVSVCNGDVSKGRHKQMFQI